VCRRCVGVYANSCVLESGVASLWEVARFNLVARCGFLLPLPRKTCMCVCVCIRALHRPGGQRAARQPENLRLKTGWAGPDPQRSIERPAIYLRADSSKTYQM